MKKRTGDAILRNTGIAVLALIMIVMGSMAGVQNVYAGFGEKTASLAEEAQELDDSMWVVPNDDLKVENGKILFTNEGNSETRIITKAAIQNTGYSDELFKMSCNINIRSLSDGERFIIGLAVDSVESYGEEADSMEVYIDNSNGLCAGIRSYNESGEASDVVEKTRLGAALGQTIGVQIQADAKMNLKVTINNKTIYDQVSPVNLEGRIIFTESAGCETELSKVNITSYTYDRPSNSNFCEDFETGAMNTETLESKMGFGAGLNGHARIDVTDYNGSKVLMFDEAKHCYFGTTQEYSNFELTFDLPYYLYKDILREDGSIKTKACGSMVIAIGAPSAATESFVYQYSAEAVVMENGKLYNLNTLPTYVANFDTSVYGDPVNNVGPSVKIRLVDTMLSVSLKSMKTGQYDEMLSYKVSTANPLGRIYICTGNNLSCAIDNFQITNLDKDANIVETGYSTFTPPTKDWEYQPYDAPYYTETDTDVTEEKSISGFVFIGGALTVGIVFLVICVILAVTGKTPKKKKEVGSNEA